MHATHIYSHAMHEPTASAPGRTGPVYDGLPAGVSVEDLNFRAADDLPDGVEYATAGGWVIWRQEVEADA